MYKPGWRRNLHTGWATLLEHQGKIVVSERNCYLVKLDPKTGELLWEVKVRAYGWLTANANDIYYLDQSGLLKIIDFQTGKCLRDFQFDSPYLRYVLVNDTYLVTGSWRGYTDLMCLHLESDFKLVWKKPTRSKELKSYSLPRFLDGSILFSDNSTHCISRIYLGTGRQEWILPLPENVGSLDLDYTFQVFEGRIFVYTTSGTIYSLDEQQRKWIVEIHHSTGIRTSRPKVMANQYVFQDTENQICSYDKVEKKLRWKIYSNHKVNIIPAIEINHDLTFVGLTMQRQMIINTEGKIITELSSERRYGSDFIEINGDIFYLTKSEVKQLTKS